MSNSGRLSVAALISGGGTNLQALIDAATDGSLGADIVVVLSNVADAGGLDRARKAGIPVEVLRQGEFPDRESYDEGIREVLGRYNPDLIVLAGFMRILGEKFVAGYEGRILNIHPSLLPKFVGLNTHQRAIDAAESRHGCTVHFVTATLDAGPPIIAGAVDVLPGDTADTLAARVLAVEHRIYPRAVGMIAAGRLEYRDGRVWLDGEVLEQPVNFLGCEIRL